MKFIKSNLHILVSTLLVLYIFAIFINSIYAGYIQYNLEDEPRMYGLMYISPDGDKEYLTNTKFGNTSPDISRIAELAQVSTAKLLANKLLKDGWLEDAGGELYVIEIMKIAHNPIIVDKPKPKTGFYLTFDFFDCDGNPYTMHYCGPRNREYYSNGDFCTNITPSTSFKTKKAAEQVGQTILLSMRSTEEFDNNSFISKFNTRLSVEHANYTEYNDFFEKSMKVKKYDTDN